MKLTVKIKLLHPDARIPVYKKKGDAGFDLYCVEDTAIAAGDTAILPTGLAVEVPDGYEIQIRMRSGAALKTPLILANAPGTIDSGYRGEVGIIARNLGSAPYTVHKGERIAQGVLAPVLEANFQLVEDLASTDRGAAGFGSTGKY